MRYRLIVVCAIVALVAGALGVSAASADTQPANVPPPLKVLVVNPLTDPVPVSVTSTVKVANAEGTKLKVDPGTVKVANAEGGEVLNVHETAPVTIESSASAPVYVKAVEQSAVQAVVSFNFGYDDDLMTKSIVRWPAIIQPFEIPDGKLFVVTHVTFGGDVPAGQTYLSVKVAGLFLPVEAQGTDSNGRAYFAASQQCRHIMYPGQSVDATVQRSGKGSYANCSIVVSGYLADLPSYY